MKVTQIALLISVVASLSAGAVESAKTNCQAKLDGNLEKNKAVKAQEAQATVFGNAQSAPKRTNTEPAKSNR